MHCPFCRSVFYFPERTVRCPHCGTTHHLACWKENHNSCSVFSCSYASHFKDVRKIGPSIRWLIACHIALNTGMHFFINSLAPLVDLMQLQDALIVGCLEALMILSGLALATKFSLQHNGTDVIDSPLVFLHFAILSANCIFVSALCIYGLAHGLDSVFALIRL